MDHHYHPQPQPQPQLSLSLSLPPHPPQSHPKRGRDEVVLDSNDFPHKRDSPQATISAGSPGASSQRNLPPFSTLVTPSAFEPPTEAAMQYHNHHSYSNGLHTIASPPLIPSPSPIPPSSAHFQHSSASQHHPFSPSTPSSYNFSTPSLSTGTMSTSSSQDCFPPSIHGGGPGSPMMDYSSSPSGVGYYQGSPTGLGMSPSMGGMMGIVGKQSHSQQLSIHHQQQLQHNHPTRIYIPPPPSNTSSNSNSNSSHASHQYRQSPRTNASAVDVYAPNGPGPPSTIGPSILGGKGKSPVMRGEWDDPTYTNRVSSHPREESQIMGSVAEYDETEEERKGSELGISLGDFDMLDTLGTGTFGKVLLSRLRPSPSRPAQTQPHYFAMKVLEKVTVVRLRQVEHLNSERKTLARVRHPFIVNLFCTFHDERNLYLLLEYVQGGELFSHLRRAGRFSADVARFYAANLVLALEYLHERDIIYRDLKPENLLIDASGYLKITDFGFAKHVTDRTYTLCGTPEYLAPEIITATGHGKAADFWALGVLLFELLAGYPPFFADSPLEIYEKILAGKFSFPPHIDFVAKDLIKRLLTADLTKRLGNLKDGAEGVKRHRWFEGVAWEAVERKEIRAPIIPHTSTPGDTSNFEHYPACPLETLPGVVRAHHARQMGVPASELESGPDPYGYLFPAF